MTLFPQNGKMWFDSTIADYAHKGIQVTISNYLEDSIMALPKQYAIIENAQCEGDTPDCVGLIILGEKLDFRIFDSWNSANDAIFDFVRLYTDAAKWDGKPFELIAENCVQFDNLTIQWNIVGFMPFDSHEGVNRC